MYFTQNEILEDGKSKRITITNILENARRNFIYNFKYFKNNQPPTCLWEFSKMLRKTLKIKMNFKWINKNMTTLFPDLM